MKSNKTQTKKCKLVKSLVMMVILLLMLSNVAAANPVTYFLNEVKETAKAAKEALKEIKELVKEGHEDLKELLQGGKEDLIELWDEVTQADDTPPDGTKADDIQPDDTSISDTNTVPEFPSYVVPVVAMLGIFLILGYRKG